MKGVRDLRFLMEKNHSTTNELKLVFIGLKIWWNDSYMIIVSYKKNNNGVNV